MKKYTIIYSETFTRGSHSHSLTRMKPIECNPKDLKETV